MIFVSLGTIHFPINRLVKAIKQVNKSCDDEIIIQYGHTTQFAEVFKQDKKVNLFAFLDDRLVGRYLSESRISIIQAGEGSWIRACESCHTPPIVVPRDPNFGEHVDNQQLLLAKMVQGQVLVAMNPNMIPNMVRNYEQLTSQIAWKKRNQIVNTELISLLNELVPPS